jgi:hypothetical protein
MSDWNKTYALPRAVSVRRLDRYPVLGVNLMAQIVSRDRLNTAWQRVRANKGAGGVDGVSIDAFNEWFKPRSQAVLEQLSNGTYQPQPVLRVVIPKPDGGERYWVFPQFWIESSSNSLSSRWNLILTLHSLTRVTAFGRTGLRMMRSRKFALASARTARLR